MALRAITLAVAAFVVSDASMLPTTMRMVATNGACSTPFSCVTIKTVPVPKPKSGEVLIRVKGTSVNPSDVDGVEMGGCTSGCGADVVGTVAACPGCKRLKVGDAVWTLSHGAYADYVVAPEAMTGSKPESVDFSVAGTIPEVGLTSFFSLKRTGSPPGTPLPAASPWASGNFSNLTVLITAGAGGTGFIGIELAKAWGAKHIATETTGEEGFKFVKSLGADFVVDYHVQDIFSALPDNSVDIVYDNYAKEGTADKAMRVIRPGGMYLMMPHGECYSKKTQGPPCLSANPKEGVRQLNYVTAPDFQHALQGLNEMRDLFAAGKLSPRIAKTFSLEDAAKAFAFSAGAGEGGVGHHYGKIAIAVASDDVMV
jgi:NADPH:quinone reductase-like Zn-dependent oxidoreductase